MDIPVGSLKGVGEATEQALISAGYETQTDVAEASIADLLAVDKIGPSRAIQINEAEPRDGLKKEMIEYRFTIEKRKWEQFKSDKPESLSLEDYCRETLMADHVGIDDDRMGLLQMRSMSMRAAQALADDDTETAREELNQIRKIISQRIG